jgi:hypothetical protein
MDVNDKELNDITVDIMDTFYRDNIVQFSCANPSDNWIFWISINDYDNDGNLDIFNRMFLFIGGNGMGQSILKLNNEKTLYMHKLIIHPNLC